MIVRDVLQGSQTPSHFQVFGERRSGTNFVEALISRSLDIEPTRKYGWKHGCISAPAISSDALAIVVVRHPLSWIVSFFNTPFAAFPGYQPKKFSAFIRSEWESEARPRRQKWKSWGYRNDPSMQGEVMQLDRHPITGKRYENMVQMRNVKLACHLGLKQRVSNFAVINYEMASEKGTDVIADLANCFQLSRTSQTVEVANRVGPKSRPAVMRTDDIISSDRQFILDALDTAQEQKVGY